MKKELILSIALFVIFLLFSYQVLAIDVESSLNSIEDTKNKVDAGINTITNTHENIKNKYLTQAWGEMIAKNRIIGPIHSFLLKYPLPFIILFNYPYEMSLTFFCIFFLWLFIVIAVSKQISSIDIFGSLAGAFLSVLAATILAQLGLIKLVVTSLLSLILSKEAWWVRLIISLIVIAFILALGYINNKTANARKAAKEEAKKDKQEQKIKEVESFMKGVKEGQKIADLKQEAGIFKNKCK